VALGQGDVTELLNLMDDELVVHRPDPDGATFRGKEGFLESIADWTEGFSDWEVVPQDFVDAGDFVVVHVLQSARGEASGIPIEGVWWFVFEVHDARVTRLSFHSRRPEALEVAGLRE
jgi:ketosteroid isomerase-like protein